MHETTGLAGLGRTRPGKNLADLVDKLVAAGMLDAKVKA